MEKKKGEKTRRCLQVKSHVRAGTCLNAKTLVLFCFIFLNIPSSVNFVHCALTRRILLTVLIQREVVLSVAELLRSTRNEHVVVAKEILKAGDLLFNEVKMN